MLYHSQAWEDAGIDMEQIVTWDDLLTAVESVELTMPDGRDRYPILDGLNATNLPARMLQKGLWWTDEAGEPVLTHPDFKVCVEDWMRFEPYVIELDWSNQVAMVKEGQVMMQLCPD